MYGDETYELSAIHDFVSTQRNIAESSDTADPLVEEQVDVLYRFTDDEKQTPALGFRHLTDDMYTLVYLDPSIATLWANEME